jgi:predicted nucleic acid-binding protein
VRTKAWMQLGIRRVEKLRDYIRRHGYGFKATLQEIIDITKKYHLLPADAIIALTCKHYGITV